MKKSYKINYKEVRKAIVKSCRTKRDSVLIFTVDFEKLAELTEKMGLIPIAIDKPSEMVTELHIPIISEYFKGEKLKWMDSKKSIMNIVFMKKADYNDMGGEEYFDSYDDTTKALANILADYPCYFGLIVAYYSKDPDRYNKLNYLVGVRANKMVLSERFKNESEISSTDEQAEDVEYDPASEEETN